MRLRDRIGAAVRAFCGDEELRTRLTVSEYERRLAEQELELRERECEGLRGELQEKESRLQFLYARTDALSSALTLEEFSHKFSTTEEMKRLYNAVSRSLDPDCFLLHRMAEQLAGVETVGLFPYEDARGVFEYASGVNGKIKYTNFRHRKDTNPRHKRGQISPRSIPGQPQVAIW